MQYVIAIDPGPRMSGLCVIDADTYVPVLQRKLGNERIIDTVKCALGISEVVIEMVGHYGTGMPAGKDVFDTCVWIGRFIEQFAIRGTPTHTLKRGVVKLNLCGSAKAKDANIIQALVDRFAPGERNHGKGTKKAPGWFYGFSGDMWQAYALGVTYLDLGGNKK